MDSVQWLIAIGMVFLFCLAAYEARDSLMGGESGLGYFVGLILMIYLAVIGAVVALIRSAFSRSMMQLAYIGVLVALCGFTLFLPDIAVNMDRKEGALTRAHYRYHQGKWAEAMRLYQVIKPIDERGSNNIMEMEEMLLASGYYPREPSGRPHRAIMSSLRKLQADHGLKEDCFVGPKTRLVLIGRRYLDILEISGYDELTHDDIQYAVTEFQRDHGLEPDGLMGPDTERALAKAQKEAALLARTLKGNVP